MRPVDVFTEIIINRDVEAVSKYTSDPDNATTWYANIKSVEWKTSRPIGVGSQVAFTAQFLGKSLTYTYEVVEFTPNEKFVMRTADGPFPMATTYRWEHISDTVTKMTLRNAGSPTGFSKLLAPFIAFAMRKANMKDLERLKKVLEKKI